MALKRNNQKDACTENAEDEDATEHHRHIFNLRTFPLLFDENGQMKPVEEHPKTSKLTSHMSQSEWLETIDVVCNFGPTLLDDANEAQSEYRSNLEPATIKKWGKKYQGEPMIR